MKKDNTLRNLILGIVAIGFLIQIVLLIVGKRHIYNAIGLWTGIVLVCGIAVHMKRSIEDALDLGEDGAIKHIRIAYATRMVVAALVMGSLIILDIGNPITLLIGMFPLKLSAYLQPYIHKILDKIMKKGG